MGKSSKGKSQTTVTNYNVSVFTGWSHSFDVLKAIYISEKLAWSGALTVSTDFSLNDPYFLGGPKKEGGISGRVWFMDGRTAITGGTPDGQSLPNDLAQRMYGVDGVDAPGYRGVSTIMFTGEKQVQYYDDYTDYWSPPGVGGGFQWTQNNPYLPTVWITATRNAINIGESDTAMLDGQANPANIIYECLRNRDWGMGEGVASIETSTFTAAAQVLYDEALVLSLGWFKQTTLEAFMQEILDHIQATLYTNPRTGKWELKLLRALSVGELAALPVFDETNCSVRNFQRRGIQDMTNELVITWTNPASEEEETVTVQDLGNITMQGGTVSGSRDYYGVRNADLAARLGYRDLRQSTTPLAGCEVLCDRSARFITPGSCIKLTYGDHNLTETVFRVGEVRYGKKGEAAVTLSVTEDVFSFRASTFITQPTTNFVDSDEAPAELAYKSTFAAPYYLAQNVEFGASPETVVATLAAQQDSFDTHSFRLLAQTTDSAGNLVFTDAGVRSLSGYAEMDAGWAEEAVTIISDWPPITQGGGSSNRLTFVVIGGPEDSNSLTEQEQEIAFIASTTEDSNSGGGIATWTVWRGVLDTIPRAWPAGTPMWFIPATGANVLDTTPRSAGAEQKYKFLAKTSLGEYTQSLADVVAVVPNERPRLPSRPANTAVDGTAFAAGTVLDLRGVDPIPVTWANRNRLAEDEIVRQWTDADEPGEALQETVIIVYDPDTDAELTRFEGLTGTSHNIAVADLPAGYERLILEIRSQIVDSNSVIELLSLQGMRYHVRILDATDSNSNSTAPTGSNSLTQDSNSTLIQGGWNRRWGFKWNG